MKPTPNGYAITADHYEKCPIAYIAADKDGKEGLYIDRPVRGSEAWQAMFAYLLPGLTKLEWEDEPMGLYSESQVKELLNAVISDIQRGSYLGTTRNGDEIYRINTQTAIDKIIWNAAKHGIKLD